MAKVYVKFPKVGLGNMLLIWARGIVFAKINNIEIVIDSWWGIRFGAWLRNENKKRIYWGYFKESSFISKLILKIQLLYFNKIKEPLPQLQIDNYPNNTIFTFNKVNIENDLFLRIRANRSIVIKELYGLLSPKLLKELDVYKIPEISVHIRRGDFKIGNPITPIDFFIDVIKLVRKLSGKELSVTVFTDATKEEIKEVFQMEGVKMSEEKADILDLLLMSKSKVIILSRSSSFSYWAAFLSNAIVLKHSSDWQEDIRPKEVNEKFFEGKVNFSIEQNEKIRHCLDNYKFSV